MVSKNTGKKEFANTADKSFGESQEYVLCPIDLILVAKESRMP